MRQITVEIDPRDHMTDCDWKELCGEALDELVAGRGLKECGAIGDLVDAREALLARRYGDALVYIERAIDEIKRK